MHALHYRFINLGLSSLFEFDLLNAKMSCCLFHSKRIGYFIFFRILDVASRANLLQQC